MSQTEEMEVLHELAPATTEPTTNHHPLYAGIRLATKLDTPIILKLIHQLAMFEKLTHLVQATEEGLTSTLFNGSPPFTSFTIFLLEVDTATPPPPSHHHHHETVHLRRSIVDPEAAVFQREGVVVAGYALFSPNYAPFLAKPGFYMEHLFVREPYRGQGLGKLLMKAVASQAVKLGHGRVDWVVLDWNEDAIRFYQKIGADIMQEYRLCRLTGDSLLSYATNQP